MTKIPDFNDVSKLHAWLMENKKLLIAQKKATIKLADAFSCSPHFLFEEKGAVVKKEIIPVEIDKIEVVSVINTTKLFDSHGDVHFDGLWDKSMKESKDDYLVKEHNFSWDGIITDQVKVTAPIVTWKSLGFNYAGNTQALTYTSTISKSEDNTGMFNRYAKGQVKQHSVGMRYIKVALGMDNKRYEEEYKIWKNYYDQIANKADVDKAAYFWAVTEAKNIEGSAVVKGSNFATPTVSVQEAKEEPSHDTRKPLHALDLKLPSSSGSIYKLKL
jgi:hypothetical protein